MANPTTTSKSLGLVKAIYVGVTPPTNIYMIWADTSTPPTVHKYFNTLTGLWTPISGLAPGAVPWLQGGNAFGATGVLGTTDNNDINFIVNGVVKLTINATTGVGTFTNNIVVNGINVGAGTDPTKGNTVVGKNIGASLTSGVLNVIIGDQTGAVLSTGGSNTFIGSFAGQAATTGSDNTFIGSQAGYATTTASNNTFLGFNAGYNNTTGANNVFIGTQAAVGSISSSGNIFIGYQTGQGATWVSAVNNTVIGYQAAKQITDAQYSVYIGYQSGFSQVGVASSSGIYNTFLGNQSGYQTTQGLGNTFLGSFAGFGIGGATGGSLNTFIGNNSGANLTTGVGNVLLGNGAGFHISSSTNNTFIGSGTGGAISSGSGWNTLVGNNAGVGMLATDFNNVIIGSYAGTGSAMNGMVVIADGGGNVRINIPNTGEVQIPGDLTLTNYSSKLSIAYDANIPSILNASIGWALLNAGTITVPNSQITNSSLIWVQYLSKFSPSNSFGALIVVSRVVGVSFTVNSFKTGVVSPTLETNDFNRIQYWIIN